MNTIIPIIIGIGLALLLIFLLQYYMTNRNIYIKGPDSNKIKTKIHYEKDDNGDIRCYYFKPRAYVCGLL
jgi:hypothetical protein